MNVSEQIAMAWQAFVKTLRLLLRGRLWVPWLLLGTVQAIVLMLFWWFAHPLVSPLMARIVEALGGEGALHYPDIFSQLPWLYSRADMVLVAVFGAIMLGASSRLFAAAHMGDEAQPGRALGGAFRRFATLILVLLPFNVLLALLGVGLGLAVSGAGGLIARLAYVFGLGASLFIQAFFLYVTQLVMLERRGVRRTFSAISRTWRHGFVAALVLGGLLLLPLLPLHFLSSQTARIVERGSPDLIGVLVFLQLLVALLVGFLLNGSATFVYLSTMTRREEMES